jgi:hypothetical protein
MSHPTYEETRAAFVRWQNELKKVEAERNRYRTALENLLIGIGADLDSDGLVGCSFCDVRAGEHDPRCCVGEAQAVLKVSE